MMLDRESWILAQLLGREDPQVRSLVWAARDPKMQDRVRAMFRALTRERGIDPDNPPAFGLPHGLSPTDYPLGRAKCGKLLGEQVGLSQDDLAGNLGVFGTTGVGKTTLVKISLLAFSGKVK